MDIYQLVPFQWMNNEFDQSAYAAFGGDKKLKKEFRAPPAPRMVLKT